MSAARKLLTLADVEAAHARGAAALEVSRATVVTPLARDTARRLGLRLDPERGARVRAVFGNWKANGTVAECTRRASALAAGAGGLDPRRLEVAIFPPFPHLALARAALGGAPVALGAQDVAATPAGAFTGAVPAAMLCDLGCSYALVGHSERRHQQGDSDAVVRQKLRRALERGLAPVLCVGETLAEREAGRTFSVLRHQLLDALDGLAPGEARGLVVAYEPVWAIGTGLTPTPAEVEAALAALRDHLARRLGDDSALATRILYGGSVTAGNAAALLALPNCDGGLVGGASLDPAGFLAIAQAVA